MVPKCNKTYNHHQNPDHVFRPHMDIVLPLYDLLMLTSYCLNIYEVRTTITDEMHFWSRAIYDILMRTLCMWAFRLQSALFALILIHLSLQALFKSLYRIADLRPNT